LPITHPYYNILFFPLVAKVENNWDLFRNYFHRDIQLPRRRAQIERVNLFVTFFVERTLVGGRVKEIGQYLNRESMRLSLGIPKIERLLRTDFLKERRSWS
jgi:hypothetical protein